MKKCIEKIIDKKFDSVINGYSPLKVDIFLDSIISDLKQFEEDFSKLEEKVKELEIENKKLKEQLEKENKIDIK
ncbi:MAG: DivIVA domain-containing protein [Mycoplasmataceae bacterium]|nr:DivIVA domain-containing protein [Mycoplasmataceae bacterium]MBR3259682.1 DivIVA domain-containing protein [Mycoplasmataceae bacterium]